MNQYVMNLKEYKPVIRYGEHVQWETDNVSRSEGYICDFGASQEMMIGGFCADLKKPSKLLLRMQQICEEL